MALSEEYLEKLTRIMREGMIYKAAEITGISEGLISMKIREPKDEFEYLILARALQELITPASEVLKIWSWYPAETWRLMRKDNRLPEVIHLNRCCNVFRRSWRQLPKVGHVRLLKKRKKEERHDDE